ncbi:MAG: hypothetical protein ACI9N1_002797 [Flavobacteriales bacterium]|jgi:hypothetical protein
MDSKLILKKYWLFMLAIPFCVYDYIDNKHQESLIISIFIVTFLTLIKLTKNDKQYKTVLGAFLSISAVGIVIDQIIKNEFNIFTLIPIISCILILGLLLTKKGSIKIQELRGNNQLQNITMCGGSALICYMIIDKGPSDILEYITIVVSGVFAVISGFFLFSDLSEN